jgi:peroxiredoxin
LGDPIPDIELIDHTGEPWRFSDHRGAPIAVVLHRHLA